MDVYDILVGRVVELVNSNYTPGCHNVILAGANLASGVYIVRAGMRSINDRSVCSFAKEVMLLK